MGWLVRKIISFRIIRSRGLLDYLMRIFRKTSLILRKKGSLRARNSANQKRWGSIRFPEDHRIRAVLRMTLRPYTHLLRPLLRTNRRRGKTRVLAQWLAPWLAATRWIWRLSQHSLLRIMGSGICFKHYCRWTDEVVSSQNMNKLYIILLCYTFCLYVSYTYYTISYIRCVHNIVRTVSICSTVSTVTCYII